jgi:hypothetical protein
MLRQGLKALVGGPLLPCLHSGVGLAAIQLAREAGAVPYATVSAGKAHVALGVGAERAIDYKKGGGVCTVIHLPVCAHVVSSGS